MGNNPLPKQFISLGSPWQDPIRKTAFNFGTYLVKKISGLSLVDEYWQRMIANNPQGFEKDPKSLIDALFKEMNISYDIKSLAPIPAKGAVVLLANHPYGMIDGLILLRHLLDIRSDVKVLVNGLLGQVEYLKPNFISVDPFDNKPQSRNAKGLRESLKWLRNEGALVIFPSGEVSSWKWRKRRVSEPAWSATAAGIARMSNAKVIPFYMGGRHNWLFHSAGLIHPRLRTLLLPRANITQKDKILHGVSGQVISSQKLDKFASDMDMIRWLRFRTYLLKTHLDDFHMDQVEEITDNALPISPPQSKQHLKDEYENIGLKRILAQSQDLDVFHCKANEAPYLIKEIGRLREETFRLVGEGTGQHEDIDHFDDTYHHLILWDKKESEICGAYRFGLTDELTQNSSVKALYTATLFDMQPGFLQKIDPAIELGRSFIVPKWQRNPQALLTLWRGMAEWCFQNPRYSKLFGVVSISADYHPLSREIIALFLRRHSWYKELAPLVKAKNPIKSKKLKKIDGKVSGDLLMDPDDISAFVAQIESGKNIPVLLKQYLKLGGRLLGFNIDPSFGDCMDGLIIVDLKDTEPNILGRFMGADKATAYLKWHKLDNNKKQKPQNLISS